MKSPAKVVKNICLTKKNTKIMKTKKILRQFTCLTRTKYTVTMYVFTAIRKISYGKQFILRVNAEQYENGTKTSDNTTNMYFNTYKELEEEIKYQYNLCKNNLFTTEIKITI